MADTYDVVVIGAGPAGLTTALDLVRLGHRVVVFDSLPVVGGTMRIGIPPHRLDYEMMDWVPAVLGYARRVRAGAVEDGHEIEVTTEPLSERALAQAVEHPRAGALALFSGVVRDQTGGRRVKFLEYEAHGPMALAKMREIAAAIRDRWPAVTRIALVHRIGRLEIGESSVMIAISSPHRALAFEACRFAIDTLKETVPIWKKEYFEDGEVWVEGDWDDSLAKPQAAQP